jgi:hypothetical protein
VLFGDFGKSLAPPNPRKFARYGLGWQFQLPQRGPRAGAGFIRFLSVEVCWLWLG